MMMKTVAPISNLVALFCAATQTASAQPLSFNGFVGLEARSFGETSLEPSKLYSLTGEINARGDLTDNLSYELRLYGRENLDNAGGGYVDPTIAKLTYVTGPWQFDAGYDLLFWGVAEGRNVVNIINQRDQIRDQFFDQGLGQSMIAARYFGTTTTLEAFVLPRFEELDFGADGRPWGLGLPVEDDNSTFESDDGDKHIDYALRVSGFAGNLEYAAFGFDGTLREPEFQFDPVSSNLVPNYALGQQAGIEAQYTAGSTLFKLESVRTRPESGSAYTSSILGLEYIVGDAFGLPAEASFFAEYYHDTHQDDPSVTFQNDVFLGTQFRFSNTLGTEIEIGAIFDQETDGVIGSVSGSSRITESLRLSAEYVFVDASDEDDALFQASDFDQVAIALEWYFQ